MDRLDSAKSNDSASEVPFLAGLSSPASPAAHVCRGMDIYICLYMRCGFESVNVSSSEGMGACSVHACARLRLHYMFGSLSYKALSGNGNVDVKYSKLDTPLVYAN